MTIIHNQNAEGFLIPCSKDQFGEFILSLLGQPRTNERRIEGTFEFKKENIQDIVSLVDQRIKSQNNGHQVSFSADVALSDGSIKKFPSMADLMSYREIRSSSPIGIMMNIIYLIHFPSKPHPEKQEVTIKIVTNINRDEKKLKNSFGEIAYEINYTDISWGEDIDHLLEQFITARIKKENPLRKFCRTNVLAIALMTGLAVFGLSIFLLTSANAAIQDIKIVEISKSIAKVKDVGAKIDFLAKLISSGVINEKNEIAAILSILSSIAAVAAYFLTNQFLRSAPPSFILLTEAAEAEKDYYQKKYNRGPAAFCLSVIIAIAINIFSSYIYQEFNVDSAKSIIEKIK